MIIHELGGPGPEPDGMGAALRAFEAGFTYPLGRSRTFHISHGDDYSRFYRSMGEAVCFVAEEAGGILGTVSAAIRRLILASEEEKVVAYIGDLKLASYARGGLILLRLLASLERWGRARTDSGLGVVMDGTPITPDRYSGRAGIPGFREAGKVVVFRMEGAPPGAGGRADELRSELQRGVECHHRLSRGRFRFADGDPRERSEMHPSWLVLRDGSACGRLEDTRKAKRLFTSEGTELLSAHLACFAFQGAPAGAALIAAAFEIAKSAGFPALFTAVALQDADSFRAALTGFVIHEAPATIYAASIPRDGTWGLNTSEI